MSLDKVAEHFEKEAFVYDELIPRLIPNYHEQHRIITGLLEAVFDREAVLKAIDLGCGTGVLSYILLKNFTNSTVVAYDLAENMLKVCKSNLAGYGDRLTLKQSDFGDGHIGEGYDIILSGLSIHHLDTEGKMRLYDRIYKALKPGGVFINREIVLGATAYLTEQYHQLWCEFIRGNGEDEQKWFSQYLDEDIPASVEDQLDWLKHAGFEDTGCHWRYLNFAIFGGRKKQ